MRKLSFLVLFLFIVPSLADAQSYAVAPPPQASPTAVLKTQETIKALMEKASIPGLAIAVAKDNRIIYSEGFGLADIENGLSVHPNTKFRIGSISKQLTAALLMKMYEEGQIDIDAPVKNYLSGLPKQYAGITPRQLAGHLGGVRHYKEGEYFNTTQYDSVKASLNIFIDDSLLHKPGTDYEYSTYGYVLLSAVLESAAGTSFLELMRSRLLEPLGMDATLAEVQGSIIFHRADFYRNGENDLIVNAPSENYSSKWAGGGYLSTVEDLSHFGLALISGRYLSRESLSEMFTSQQTASGEKTGYGIGWRPDEDWEGRSVVRHGGSSSGARSFIILYPDQGLSIAILTNKERAPVFEGEAGVIADYFLDDSDSLGIEGGIDGAYSYERVVNDEKRGGILTLIKTGTTYTGTISNFYSAMAPIVNVQKQNDKVVISAATASGIANFWLKFDEYGFEGESGWDSPSQKISGRRLKMIMENE